jgi:hypothetical protein
LLVVATNNNNQQQNIFHTSFYEIILLMILDRIEVFDYEGRYYSSNEIQKLFIDFLWQFLFWEDDEMISDAWQDCPHY